MLPYTKGAKALIHALKALEDEGEFIRTDRALLTLADLSPVELVLAKALRSIWNDASRRQLRQGTSGRPGTDHLGLRNLTAFRLLVFQGEAEREATAAGDQEIGERHIAKALTIQFGAVLRELGIDANQLVAEVTAMERGPVQERINQALELERLRFAKAQEEMMRAVAEASAAAQVDSSRRGLSGSGLHMGSVIEAHANMLKRMATKRVEIRKEAAQTVPALASKAELTRLRQEIEGMIDAQWANLHVGVARHCGGPSVEGEARQRLDSGQWADTPMVAKILAGRELGILEREASLGLAAATAQSVIVNIQDSTVATLNLGTVMGDIRSVVASLQQGQPEVAVALQKLVEAVAADETLGDRRRDAIESLGQIGEEATRPEDRRRTGLVKTLLAGIPTLLAVSANATQIWQTFGPIIARHFGIPWP